jgi:antitoxin CcdA
MHVGSALDGLERALKAAGGTYALTRALGYSSPSIIGNWRRAGGIPAARVPDVARVTGLPPEILRPDLFASAPRMKKGMAETQAPFSTEARALGLDPEAIARKAICDAIKAEKERRWLEENREAIEAQNAWVEKHGVPLAKYRMF